MHQRTPLRVAFAAWLALALGFLEPPILSHVSRTSLGMLLSHSAGEKQVSRKSRRRSPRIFRTSMPSLAFHSLHQQLQLHKEGIVPFGLVVGGAIAIVVAPGMDWFCVVVESWSTKSVCLSEAAVAIKLCAKTHEILPRRCVGWTI
jgi:hypothetical protein